MPTYIVRNKLFYFTYNSKEKGTQITFFLLNKMNGDMKEGGNSNFSNFSEKKTLSQEISLQWAKLA